MTLELTTNTVYSIYPQQLLEVVLTLPKPNIKIKKIHLNYELSKDGLLLSNWKLEDKELSVLVVNINPFPSNETRTYVVPIRLFPTENFLTVVF